MFVQITEFRLEVSKIRISCVLLIYLSFIHSFLENIKFISQNLISSILKELELPLLPLFVTVRFMWKQRKHAISRK